MKKLPILLMIICSNLFYSQIEYKKIDNEDINQDKVQLSEKFIQSYLTKCSSQDYSDFVDFNLSKGHKNFVNQKLEEICLGDEDRYGKIELIDLNSVYKTNDSFFGRTGLYIFNAKTEKDKTIKYLSVWISKNDLIEGMVITSYKPFKKKN